MTALSSNNLRDPQKWEKFIPLAPVAEKMMKEGLSKDFVLSLLPLAFHYEGVYDLIMMWGEETDQLVKDEIVADLQEELDEEQGSKIMLPRKLKKEEYLHFDNLEEIAKDVIEFKKYLRIEIDRWGSINRLSQETGIPQPSLSRFLNSASLPRRNTLEKIAKALGLKESILLSKWTL